MKKKILDLKPTQFAVGMLEVDEKIKAFGSLKPSALKKLLRETRVPVVVDPHGDCYIVDKHHFLFVCHSLGVKKVRVEVLHDFSKLKRKLSFEAFWKWMGKTRNFYPFCQFGDGPRKAFYLPKDIRGVADDPYRSLAWFVRKAGAFENSDRNFAEFKWANFFRSKRILDKHGVRGFEQACEKAVALSQTPAARRLPGYSQLQKKKREAAQEEMRRIAKKVKKNKTL